MRLRFTKMQGAGNDFVVVDAVREPVSLATSQWRAIADRHFGVGADQILLVEPARSPQADFRYRIFNADGEEVEHCGNGARCFVRFVREKGLTDKRVVRVETLSGILELVEQPDGQVSVEMGYPRFEPAQVPFDPTGLVPWPQGEETLWPLAVDGDDVLVAVLSMGNPHAVLLVDDVDAAPVARLGARIEHAHRFARRVNVGFMQVLDAQQVRLRVWERGAGETLACGTGACAAVVSGIRRGCLRGPVAVHARGGTLSVDWRPGEPVRMSGPAQTVFEGEIDVTETAQS